MAIEDYQLDILVQGYPGKSVCHGGLGWSTIVLLHGIRAGTNERPFFCSISGQSGTASHGAGSDGTQRSIQTGDWAEWRGP